MLLQWHGFSSVTGFYLALLVWLAIDFLTVGILFSIDAYHIHRIDHEMYVGGYTAQSISGGGDYQGNDYSSADAGSDYQAAAAGGGYRHLKASSNYLSWCFELELCCAVAAFVLSYYYAWFAINLRRFANDLLYDGKCCCNYPVAESTDYLRYSCTATQFDCRGREKQTSRR